MSDPGTIPDDRIGAHQEESECTGSAQYSTVDGSKVQKSESRQEYRTCPTEGVRPL
eukprot:CAMPEP_0175876184 /NCGR_PEP_ID=MMETSP0107_2-20121207/39896_1 /TAXON_ID=195067 ORGANISM="Goniomonas pacifica, Strain CCMP1869" /NCGR_SAMPLE_ID=MMETSP0107_2 /ASSEMBLY_ACC=CAM_ASM_000203 /LENGTH=55 /DNA_ID=CAMNT_0017195339 /DNA_START=42 /DNA_END=205 /DNA_ORIENTATION=-